MKKYEYQIKIILSIIILLIGIYFAINIYFVFSNVNGQLYDGFGNKYVNGEPHSKYTIVIYACFILGLTTFVEANEKRSKQKTLEQLKNKNIKDIL